VVPVGILLQVEEVAEHEAKRMDLEPKGSPTWTPKTERLASQLPGHGVCSPRAENRYFFLAIRSADPNLPPFRNRLSRAACKW
jgi:hypothetical protein